MINLNITGRNFEVPSKLREYVEDQIGALDKYLPRGVRPTVQGTVVLELDPSGREDNQYVCEVILSLQGAKMQSKEGTVNIYASVDVVQAKLKSQMRTYKDKHTAIPRRSKVLTRLIGRMHEADQTTPTP